MFGPQTCDEMTACAAAYAETDADEARRREAASTMLDVIPEMPQAAVLGTLAARAAQPVGTDLAAVTTQAISVLESLGEHSGEAAAALITDAPRDNRWLAVAAPVLSTLSMAADARDVIESAEGHPDQAGVADAMHLLGAIAEAGR